MSHLNSSFVTVDPEFAQDPERQSFAQIVMRLLQIAMVTGLVFYCLIGRRFFHRLYLVNSLRTFRFHSYLHLAMHRLLWSLMLSHEFTP